jgi:hypothetical protein
LTERYFLQKLSMLRLSRYTAPAFFFLLWAAAPRPAHAQSGCQLVPVPLAQRSQQARLVVEARVASQQVASLGGHLLTRNVLEVFKVFRGQLPAGSLSVLTQGGTLGARREVVSGALALAPGQQGMFFLEADPELPGELRAYAGPQGFSAYDLASGTASEPFAGYASIAGTLYEAVAAGTGAAYREVAPNARLQGALSQRRAARTLAVAAPTISDFSPKTVTAGTSSINTASANGVLTITGVGFGDPQGNGYVQFSNANNGGASFTRPVATDYLSWSDTQIQVRVPSFSQTGSPAGTGLFQVVENGGTLATSATPLTVTYALSNANSDGLNYRVHLISPDGSGGYVLQYASSFPAEAKAPFERALRNWRTQAAVNRVMSATPAPSDVTSSTDEVNVVRFDPNLPTGVLGVTYSYYSGCVVNKGPLNWQVVGTDYAYAPVPVTDANGNPAYFWNFGPGAPTGQQYDFESVALHELGHGAQLSHLISPGGVMHYAINNGATSRVLDAATDLTAARNVGDYSTSATSTERCSLPIYRAPAAEAPLPVQLTAFGASYQPGQGTRLSWATASESNSAAFVVESQDDPAGPWLALARVAAAGSSLTPRQYQARDARPLAGTRYYRLRQLDLDGATAYSPVVPVSATATGLAAYPNPATGAVHLSGPLAAGTAARVRLLDATGRCVASLAGPAGQAAFELPLAGVPAGLYVLEWDGGTGRTYLRLVVE